MTDAEGGVNILKFAWAWITIAFVIDIIFIGFVVTGGVDPESLPENTLYSLLANSSTNTFTTFNNIGESYDVDDIGTTEEESSSLLDKLDVGYGIAKWLWFPLVFLGAAWDFIWSGFYISSMITNNMIAFALGTFLTLAHITFVILTYKFIRNKGRVE